MPEIRTLEMSGVVLDLPPASLPPNVWTFLRNAGFPDGIMERGAGWTEIYPGQLHQPRWLLNSRLNRILSLPDVSFWIYPGDTNVAVIDANTGVHTDITGAAVFDTALLTNPWTGGLIQDVPFLNSPDNVPQFWDQDILNPIQPLPGWPAGDITRAIRPFQTFLIAMDITVGSERFSDLVRWSAQAPPNNVPPTWVPDPTNSAGELSLGFLPGPVIDGAELRNNFYLYKRHSVWRMQLIGGTFVFQQQPVFSTFGALSRNCIVELIGKHLVITDGDVVLHDGTIAKSIVNRRIRNAIFREISGEFFENSFAALNRQRNEVWVCVPTSEEFPTVAAVWDIDEDTWGLRDIPLVPIMASGLAQQELPEGTWDTRLSTWDTDLTRWSDKGISPIANSLLMTDRTNSKFQVISALFPDEDGRPIQAIIQRTMLDFDTPASNKWVSRLWPNIDAPSGTVITIRAGGVQATSDPINWGPRQPFTVGTDEFVNLSAQGKYLSFEFASVTLQTWRMAQFEVEFTVTGRF